MSTELYRVQEVAELLGVSRGRVYQLVADHQIPAIRISGAIRIPRYAWERWIEEQLEAGRNAARS